MLANHNCSQMSVRTHHLGKYRSIDNAQSFDSEHAADRINHRSGIIRRAHTASTRGVLNVEAMLQHPSVARNRGRS